MMKKATRIEYAADIRTDVNKGRDVGDRDNVEIRVSFFFISHLPSTIHLYTFL